MDKRLDDAVAEAISKLTERGYVVVSITPVAVEDHIYCVIVFGEPEGGDA